VLQIPRRSPHAAAGWGPRTFDRGKSGGPNEKNGSVRARVGNEKGKDGFI